MMRNSKLLILAILLAALAAGVVVMYFQHHPRKHPVANSTAQTNGIPVRAVQTNGIPDSPVQTNVVEEYTGSTGCRDCHEPFYQKWATSHHGLAMQPYTDDFAKSHLLPQPEAIQIRNNTYRYIMEKGVIRESGATGDRDYSMIHVMGGKNVYYFLTPLEHGKLQVLPLAYDVQKKEWYDNPGSGVRHFADAPDEALEWTDRLFTFNTACFSCHISQLATRYDFKADSYRTTWREPGINCETCHGPGREHVRVCQAAPTNQPPTDLKIISTRTMTAAQRNDLCSTCHARLSPITATFTPGNRFFDHFDLIGLEHQDFHPDGRDLGENYTMTGWLLSPCVKSGKLDCLHCHTSSGRYRFPDAEANNACLPCHAEQVEEGTAHTHHPPDCKAGKCVSCHMPTTRFANMNRTDHSMRPPMPQAARAFGSSLACLGCHTDHNPEWANDQVDFWRPNSKVAVATLHWGGLIADARRGDWGRLPEMLEYLQRTNREEIVASSLLRLSLSCQSASKWPVIQGLALSDPSPLVRSAAVDACQGNATPGMRQTLLKALSDDYRLVRVRAAQVLAGMPEESLPESDRAAMKKARAELETSLHLRQDDAASHFNLGNYHGTRGDLSNSIAAYEAALSLRPDYLPALVNVAMILNSTGRNDEAERHLRDAVGVAPSNAAVRLNLALLLGEMNRLADARAEYLQVIRIDPTNATAAYNLAVLSWPGQPAEAVQWAGKAAAWRPDEPRYAYNHAYFLMKNKNPEAAIAILKKLLERFPDYTDARQLLRQLTADTWNATTFVP